MRRKIKINSQLVQSCDGFRTHSYTVPMIKFTGKWLERIGFTEGSNAKLEYSDKKIIIILDDPTPKE